MTHLRPVRVLGTLFAAALALTLTAAGPMPAIATGGGKPSTPAAVPGGAGTRSLPAGASACASTRAKPSSPFAACRAAPAPRSTATVSLPAGSVPCASTPSKPSSRTASCAGGRARAAAAPLDPWIIGLGASPLSLLPGQTSTLTATTNQDVGPTFWWIEIFNVNAGSLVAQCAFGTSCSVTVGQSGFTVQTYVAYVSTMSSAFPPPNIQATSNDISVAWLSASISASALALLPGGTVTLTATSAADVGPTPFFLQIFDETTGALVVECGFGTVCSSDVTQGSAARTYVATIAASGLTFPPPDLRLESSPIFVSWISVSLATDPASLPVGGQATLTATASLDVGPTRYSIEIFDLTQNVFVVICESGATCSSQVFQQSPTTHAYVAYVSGFGTTLPPPDIRASSSPAFVTWV